MARVRVLNHRCIETEDDIREGVRSLRRKCKIMRRVHDAAGEPPLRRREAGFEGLARIVVAQQLSVASATAIWARFELLVNPLAAERLLVKTDDDLRGVGLSGPKIRTLRAMSQAVADGLDLTRLGTLNDEEVHSALTADQRYRPVDSRCLPPVLPWARGCVRGRRSGAADRRATCFRAGRAAPPAHAPRARRALAALARCRGAIALGVLSDGQSDKVRRACVAPEGKAGPMLDGPRLEAASGSADALVVLLHGYGANGEDLIALGQEWRRALPRAAFVAPNAPEALPMAGMGGLQWFPLTMRDPTEYWRGVSAAGPGLAAFLEAELKRHRLPPQRLALVGFSQGTMMALHVGLRLNPPPAALIGYSGMLAGPEHLGACRCVPARRSARARRAGRDHSRSRRSM